ncbi:MAG: hypothetical protein HRU41_33485 [Saprospiraceae bacterium]|nr:hypothetical protein [Saprospiraceae bacterium]
MRLALLLLSVCYLGFSPLSAQKGMNNKKMGKVLEENASALEGQAGSWQVFIHNHVLLVVTDEENNRMRIFTPIMEESELDKKQLRNMLIANFHTALDAKYSIYEGFVISTFTHPLKELTEWQLVDALSQVAKLAENFGTTYSSTDLIFGGKQDKIEQKRLNQSPSKGKRS